MLFQQFIKLCASLVDQGSGKSAGRLLAFSGQILYSHIEERDVLFKPAQGFLHAGDAEIRRKHRVSDSYPDCQCFRRDASLKLNTRGANVRHKRKPNALLLIGWINPGEAHPQEKE
jgi:hypothetical protein